MEQIPTQQLPVYFVEFFEYYRAIVGKVDVEVSSLRQVTLR